MPTGPTVPRQPLRVLKILRGMLGTAVAFAVPWAVAGGAIAAVVNRFFRDAITGPMPEFHFAIARSGPLVFGVLGAVAGASYALVLALRGRRWTFEELTARRVVALGATGGLAVGAALFGAAGWYFRFWPAGYSMGVGISALLGAGSAAAMFAWARRSRARMEPPSVERPPDPRRLAEAQAEIEAMLLERRDRAARPPSA